MTNCRATELGAAVRSTWAALFSGMTFFEKSGFDLQESAPLAAWGKVGEGEEFSHTRDAESGPDLHAEAEERQRRAF